MQTTSVWPSLQRKPLRHVGVAGSQSPKRPDSFPRFSKVLAENLTTNSRRESARSSHVRKSTKCAWQTRGYCSQSLASGAGWRSGVIGNCCFVKQMMGSPLNSKHDHDLGVSELKQPGCRAAAVRFNVRTPTEFGEVSVDLTHFSTSFQLCLTCDSDGALSMLELSSSFSH